jgi:hypothetical protein
MSPSQDMVGMNDGTVLVNVHTIDQCHGQDCCIHNPSNHYMADWPYRWDSITKLMLRRCRHDFLHPDPDDLAFRRRRHGLERAAIKALHDCDGCCQPLRDKELEG